MTLLERYDAILKRVGEEVAGYYGPRLVACAVFGRWDAARRARTRTSISSLSPAIFPVGDSRGSRSS